MTGAWQVGRYVRDVEDCYSGALALLPLLPLSMMTAWRLHAFARMPGALDAVVNGTLCARTAPFQYDAGAVRTELVRQLERLTGSGTRGLGRAIYGSHPSLTSRARGGEMAHALIWHCCPGVAAGLLPHGCGPQWHCGKRCATSDR